MRNFRENVIYLEKKDLLHGKLPVGAKHPISGKPCFQGWAVVLVQGSYCGFCNEFKPAFQALADAHPHIQFATIQIDGSQPGERDILSVVPGLVGDMPGVPHIARFHNGVFQDAFQGNRTKEDCQNWLLSK